jgi:hypothetical protein
VVLVKSVEIDIGVRHDREAKAAIDAIDAKAEHLKKIFGDGFALKIDKAAAAEKLRLFRTELAEATRPRTAEVKVKVDDSALSRFAAKMKGAGGPGWLGPALLGLPLGISLAGAGAGAAAGLGGAAIAGGGALAAFGAVAKPVFAAAQKAAQAAEKAQNNYNIAIANGVKPAVAYKAEQIAIGKAYAELSPAQIALSKQLQAMGNAWQAVKAAQTPVVAGALQPWLKSVTDLTGKLGPIIAKVSPVIGALGKQFDALINSAAFTHFRDFIANTGSKVVGAAGGTLIDFIKAFMILLPKFNPLIEKASGWIASLGPAVLTWANSKKTSDDITKFMAWFSRNGPAVGGLLKNIGGALKALAPGLGPASLTEISLISSFFGLIAKLPPSFAKPLVTAAATLLTLNKLGVVKVGVDLSVKGLGALGALAGGGAGLGGGLAAGAALLAGGFFLNLRNDLKAGWRGIARDLPSFLTGIPGILSGAANGWTATITDHFAKPVRRMWADLGHFLAASFDQTRHDVARVADNLGRYLAGSFDQTRHGIARIWDQTRHDASSAWDTIWNNTVGRAQRGVGDVERWFGNLRSGAALAVRGAGTWLLQAGKDVIRGFWNGLTAVWRSVTGWISGIASWIKSHKGPVSLDQNLLYPAGHAMMSGFLGGLKAGFGPVGSFVGGIASWVLGKIKGAGGKLLGGKIVADTSGFAFPGVISGALGGDARANKVLALSMFPWPSSMFGAFDYLEMREAGYNRFARNPSSGAYGIPQALPESKLPFAGQAAGGSHAGAQLAWMFSYIRSVYGNPVNAANHERMFNWYAGGTSSAAPGWAWVGERGPELVRFRGGEQVAPAYAGGRGGTRTVIIKVEVDPAVAASTPDRTLGRHIAQHVTKFIAGGGRLYPAGTVPR